MEGPDDLSDVAGNRGPRTNSKRNQIKRTYAFCPARGCVVGDERLPLSIEEAMQGGEVRCAAVSDAR